MGPAGDPAPTESLGLVEGAAALPEAMAGELAAGVDGTDDLELMPLAATNLLRAFAGAVVNGAVPTGAVAIGAVPTGAVPTGLVMEADG